MDDVDSILLNTGYQMPTKVYGTGFSSQVVVDNTDECCRQAIEVGYRHLDCAHLYQTEKTIGETLQKLYKENKIQRENLFITSKLWATYNDPKDVREGFMKSLADLQTEYLDLFLIHLPTALPKSDKFFPQKDKDGKYMYNTNAHYVDTWKELEKLQEEGLVRSIGISNFNEYQINKIIEECSIIPAVHQIETHPYLIAKDHVEFCKKTGIAVVGYAVLGSKSRSWATENDPVDLDDPVIKSIAEKHKKTPAQIAIRL